VKRALTVCVLAACASTGDGIDWAPAEKGCGFLRVRNGRIETAVLRTRTPSGAIVDLAGVYHVGGADYYAALERHLPGAEIVISESKMSFVDETTRKDAIDPDLKLIHRYQIAVARALGLTLQARWERGIADGRWMPLDLPLKRQAEAGRLLSDEARANAERVVADPEAMRDEIRAGLLAAAREPAAPSDAQRRRDDAIREGLARVLKHQRPRRVVVLFGPAHLRALAPTLGYQVESVVWYPVMTP
jgi:hypothetical protein